ncbi:hypothetical protein HOE04_03265 [archaeon]|jgi:hypothetical protein|nr:hypothetical protein [archaeon]
MKKMFAIFILFLIIVNLSLIQASVHGNVYKINEDIGGPIVNATIIFYSVDNETYEILSDNEGSFYLGGNNENLKSIEVYIEECLVFQNNLNIFTKENLSFDVSIFDISFCKREKSKGEISSFAYTPSCSNFPNSLVYGPSSKDQTETPIILVHGWSNDADSSMSGWGSLDYELDKDYDVFRLQYWPANLSNRKNAFIVDYEINRLLNAYYSEQDYFNVISHSMGGLAVRGYIQGLAKSCNGNTKSYRDNIDNYVIVASPMKGTYFTNLINGITDIDLTNDHPNCQKFIEGDYLGVPNLEGKSEATLDMEIGSDFTWNLNKNEINSNVNYLSISGSKILDRVTDPLDFVYDYCLSNRAQINDWVVSLPSSNLAKKGYLMILMDKFHTSPFLEVGIGDSRNTAKLSTLFFQGKLNYNSANEILDKNIGEAYYSKQELNPDMPDEFYHRSMVILEIDNSEININKVELKDNHNDFYKLEKNINTGRWFYVNLLSGQNTLNFDTTLPNGRKYVYINDKWTNYNFILNPQNDFININLDKDSDNYDLQNVGGSDCNDENPNINPSMDELCNDIDDDCDEDIDETFYDKGNVCYNGIGECKVDGEMVCSVDGGKTECNAVEGLPVVEICDDDLDNDCDGLIDYQDGEDCIEDISLCEINLPKEEIYPLRRIPFDIQATEKLSRIEYIDYSDSRPRWKKLCSKCDKYDREKSFKEGEHEVKIKCTPYIGVSEIYEVNFFNDYTEPKISKVEPKRNAYTNGDDFYIKFKEKLPKDFQFSLGNELIEKEDCSESRGYYECYFNMNLSQYNNQGIFYSFSIEDYAGNKDKSKPLKVNVDMTNPVINNFDNFYEFNGKYIYFDISITEKNFDEAVLKYDYRGRTKEKRLCSRLRGGKCEKKFRFKSSYKNMKLIVKDEAGNKVEVPMILVF